MASCAMTATLQPTSISALAEIATASINAAV
jgi:hypothetical protein